MTTEPTTQVGADEVLTFALPLGREEANKTAHIIVKTMNKEAGLAMSQEEWRRFVHSMAGRVNDPTFERPPQGEYEQREELP